MKGGYEGHFYGCMLFSEKREKSKNKVFYNLQTTQDFYDKEGRKSSAFIKESF